LILSAERNTKKATCPDVTLRSKTVMQPVTGAWTARS
jgi:hypothetical protein